MERIEPSKVIRQWIATGLGLDKYVFIEENFSKVDVSQNEEFQRKFNDFYRVRKNACHTSAGNAHLG